MGYFGRYVGLLMPVAYEENADAEEDQSRDDKYSDKLLLHASFRPRLVTMPLRFAITFSFIRM
jgi:hypothetical protein